MSGPGWTWCAWAESFKTGASLQALVTRDGGDWPAFLATIARSRDPAALTEVQRRLPLLLGRGTGGWYAWDLEKRIGQAFGVYDVNRSFSLFPEGDGYIAAL